MAKTIITLGREYCTGGRYIAKDVARALGIKLYDKELITMAAKNSGLSEEAVAASEKRHTHSLLYSLYTMGNDLPLGDQVFILQSRIIKQLADEGPCVIVGRCGDYVLRDRKDVLRIFVYAPKEWRLAYGKENNMLQAKDEKGIKDEIDKTDRDMFSGPVVIDKGAALTHDFTHGELNQLLLNTFDLEAGTEAAVRFAVYAKNADEEFDAQLSEIKNCAITPKTTYPNFPPSLIMVGAATPWQWDLNAGLELPESREGSHLYQASGVELRVQPMSLNNGFKFYFSRNVNDTDDPRFAAQDLSAETFGKIAVYKSGEAQFQPGSFGYENGVYDIEVNLNTMKMTLTAKSIDYSTAYSMTGEATPGGWESRTYRPKKGDNEWEATGVAMNFDGDYKGFKIFASSDGWWPWYGQTPDAPFGTVIRIDDQATSDAKGAPQFYPSRFGYASGTYTINLNLNTMTLTLTKEN